LPEVFPRLCHALHILLDVAALCFLFILATRVNGRLGIALPAGVVGMGILFLLLAVGIVPLKRIKPGADWLLAEMLLFFVLACVGIVRYFSLLEGYGIRLLAAVAVGTASVIVSTALVVDLAQRLERRIQLRTLRQHRRQQLRLNPDGVA
jgi:holin-like protein